MLPIDEATCASRRGEGAIELTAAREFLKLFRSRTSACISNAYIVDHEPQMTKDGILISSLPIEVFFVVNIQVNMVRDFASSCDLLSEAEGRSLFFDALRFIFENLKYKQRHYRNSFLHDLESCCAAANDFFRMSELTEDLSKQLVHQCHSSIPICPEHVQWLRKESEDLVAVFVADSVYSAQIVQSHVFEQMSKQIETDLFSMQWECLLDQNEVALKIVVAEEDYLEEIFSFLGNDLLVKKTADAFVSKTVAFYLLCLLKKARHHRKRSTREKCFLDSKNAAKRILGDIQVMKNFFRRVAASIPALSKVVEKEFEALIAVYEFMSIAAGTSEADAFDFMFVLHKLTGEFDTTRRLLNDLWYLMAPGQERQLWLVVSEAKDTFCEISASRTTISHQHTDVIQSIHNLLVCFYSEDQSQQRGPRLIDRLKYLDSKKVYPSGRSHLWLVFLLRL